MGYRSEVRCLVYPSSALEPSQQTEAYNTLKMLMNTTFKDVMDDFGANITFIDVKEVVDFEINDVKWYDSWDDVSRFMAMLPQLEEAGFSYEYIRVGEDSDDIEYRNTENNLGFLGTHTAITCYY